LKVNEDGVVVKVEKDKIILSVQKVFEADAHANL
jgi:hypothetical protein